MAIAFECPGCGRRIIVNDSMGGERVRCPKCKKLRTVPEEQPNDVKAPRAKQRDEVLASRGKSILPKVLMWWAFGFVLMGLGIGMYFIRRIGEFEIVLAPFIFGSIFVALGLGLIGRGFWLLVLGES